MCNLKSSNLLLFIDSNLSSWTVFCFSVNPDRNQHNKGNQAKRALSHNFLLMWYQLLVFGVLLECNPSGSWNFDAHHVYSRHIACCRTKFNPSHHDFVPCCKVLLLQCISQTEENRCAGERNISFCEFIHFSTEEFQTASQGENLQKPIDEDLRSSWFPKYIPAKCIQNGSVLCFSKTKHAQIHILSLMFALMLFHLRKMFKIDVDLPYGMLNDASHLM